MKDSDEQHAQSANESPTGHVGEVYRDLLAWGVTLPRWQQELLRRILRARTVSDAEVGELATAAVSETEQQASGFAVVSHADLPAVAALEAKRVLCGMKDLRNVNALRSDQTLTFGEQLTVVYGDNASGKSGYGRVLKKVFRARVVEQILGDVRSEAPSPEGPSAAFSVKAADGAESTVGWKDGTPVTGLGRFAVLDCACSVTYIRGGTLAVGPAGIDIPSSFADDLDRVRKVLASRASAAQPDKKTLHRLEGDTEAGRFVRGLSSSTSEGALTAASAWNDDHARELQELERAVADAKAVTPSARRTQLRARLQALESVGKRLATWIAAVSQPEILVEALRATKEADVALQAVRTLGDANVSNDLVQDQRERTGPRGDITRCTVVGESLVVPQG